MMIQRKNKRKNTNPFVIQEGRLKYGDFAGRFKRGWIEDAFTPTGEGQETVANHFNTTFLVFLKWCLACLIILLGTRLLWLQIAKGEYYRDMANGNRLRLERLEASRGTIYDSNEKPLVHNIANFLLYCIPADLPKDITERKNLFEKLANLTGQFNSEEVIKSIESIKPSQLEYYQPIFLADNISYEAAIKTYLESLSSPGVILSSKSRREYQTPSLSFSHILGYTGKISEKELKKDSKDYTQIDYIGKSGLEKTWEKELRGKPGVKQIEVTALGKEKSVVSELTSIPGNDLILSIDANIQKKLEEILSDNLKKLNRQKGVGIIMNPQNGEIIALVSLPTFDVNVFARGITIEEYQSLEQSIDKPLFNRAVSGEYPSGSTIKPIIAAAALQEKIISSDTSFLSTGGLQVGQWSFPDWKAGGHGVSNVRKAIAESVNTFFYYIGGGHNDFQGLGIDKMVVYLKKFLLGQTLGIDLPNEASGFVPTKAWKEEVKKEKWYIGDTYHVAIGQGDLITTPLQVSAYTSYFANGSTLFQPHLVKEVRSPDGHLVTHISPKPLAENIVSPEVVRIVREGMKETTISGSARSLSVLPVSSAGKTGTAQWSSKKDPHAWFTGFAPFENPELVITILVEEGKEGSVAATPVAREFLQWYFGEYKKK
ncbi:penicillin-binding protein 2 [Candidatus Falkowbacteria bacterium]|nr:MAG: penicillin-binding protein 2 [Candidatus Falkowbacteria bacterium]